MREVGLSADERAAMRAADRHALIAHGGHPYLIFMAELRLRSDRGQTKYEYF
jgi:hypothetical protein